MPSTITRAELLYAQSPVLSRPLSIKQLTTACSTPPEHDVSYCQVVCRKGSVNENRLVPTKRLSLYPGSTFRGTQKCERNQYDVTVTVKHVDLERSFMCGYLNIEGLTDGHPVLTTFFEGEIIGPTHSFLTRKWHADETVDRRHWEKFPGFQAIEDKFNADGFQYDFMNSDYIFMRWKEHFLVPDHKIRSIDGASFAGFYYVCYQVSTGQIKGFYYHKNSEWFQELKLKHVPEKSFSSFEFR